MSVVVGVDGTPGSYAAIRLGHEEARLRGTELVAVMAYSGEGALGTPGGLPLSTPRSPAEDQKLAESTLDRVVKAALGDDSGVVLRVESGSPGRVLVDTARVHQAVMVVLSARKERTPSRLLGAVSQYVLRNAPCPVLVVPEASKAR
ncbi:MAG TPA: universal stress protein [Streptosporangiaceae bacterium]|jgi:nucleotide-binding universal stress UspA family protein|nr:universal stress protein [Streptosporangiaceae bacterium]